MGLHLFSELNRTTAAYCRSLGLDAAPYETALSPAEVEVAEYMRRHGVSHSAASMLIAVNHMPASPVATREQTFRAVVEYARPVILWDRQSIQPYYDDCRARSSQLAGVFTGD